MRRHHKGHREGLRAAASPNSSSARSQPRKTQKFCQTTNLLLPYPRGDGMSWRAREGGFEKRRHPCFQERYIDYPAADCAAGGPGALAGKAGFVRRSVSISNEFSSTGEIDTSGVNMYRRVTATLSGCLRCCCRAGTAFSASAVLLTGSAGPTGTYTFTAREDHESHTAKLDGIPSRVSAVDHLGFGWCAVSSRFRLAA